MTKTRLLIFTACYNERSNIGLLIDEVFMAAPDCDMLVVDDSSPDGTWDIIVSYQKKYPRLHAVKRPGKLGIGSAHKYALYFAMREGYEKLLTMDADFSHDPKFIPALLAESGTNIFVTGSRYCEGGSSDYEGYRDRVSRLGNFAARHMLGVPLREMTTYFRVFDVASLRRLPLQLVQSNGYSYGVQLIYYLRKSGVKMREVPIHFADRLHGESKIPKLQIIMSAADLARMWIKRALDRNDDLEPEVHVDDACISCGDRMLAMKYAGQRSKSDEPVSEATSYQCTAVGTRSYPPVYTCLHCGHDQVPASAVPPQLETLYGEVEDLTYLDNVEARRHTYSRAMDRMDRFLPPEPGSMLEVGAYCGLFLKEAKKRHWQVDGVEPSRWAAEYANRVSGVNVLQGFLPENSQRLRKKYDVVVSWDVLEHVRDPGSFLCECREKLSDNGTLFFSTLDTSNWVPRLLKTKWPWLMDMHIQYFSTKSVNYLLERSGFELLAAEPYTHYARLRYFFDRGARVLPNFLNAPIGALTKLIPASLMIPVAFGDIKMYVARKRPSTSKSMSGDGA